MHEKIISYSKQKRAIQNRITRFFVSFIWRHSNTLHMNRRIFLKLHIEKVGCIVTGAINAEDNDRK